MANKIFKKLISYLIIASLFISGSGIADFGFTLEWYHILYLAFSCMCVFTYHKFSKKIFGVLTLICIYSLLSMRYDVWLFVKQFANISLSLFTFYNYLLWEDFDYAEIFSKYVKFSKAILIIGFVQVLAFILSSVGIPAGRLFIEIFPWLQDNHVNISTRLQAISQEPSFLAYALVPVVFLSVYNLLHKNAVLISKSWSFWFIVGYLLTSSLVAYVGIILMVGIIYMRNLTLTKLYVSGFAFIVIATFGVLSYLFIPDITLRVDDSLTGASKDILDPKVYRAINITSYSALTNLYVTTQSVKEHPLFGAGLGSYQSLYDLYLPEDLQNYFIVNREDADSLALRLLAETGTCGLGLFLLFIYRYRIRSAFNFNESQNLLWIINSGAFVLLIMFLIRSGNYTFQGRMLFVLLYYYSSRAYRDA